MDILSDNQKILLNMCAHALFGNGSKTFQTNRALVKEAEKQAVLSLVGKLFISPTISCRHSILRYQAKNVRIENEHIILAEFMEKAQIPYVVLKGSASAAYYREPLLRTLGDVDFLVKKEDLEATRKILEENAFETDSEASHLHYAYKKDDSIWELHFRINGIPQNETGKIIEQYFSDVFEESYKCDRGYSVPSDFHHGLILLLHTASHLINEGIGLRHLCDIATFINKFTNEQFCDMFYLPLKKIGLWKFMQVLTATCVKHLGADNKDFAEGIEDSLVDALVCDILDGGNFGTKQENRSEQIKFIGDRNDRTVNDKSVFHQLFVSLNQKTKLAYPFLKNKLLLLPIGWAAVSLNYFALLLKGKRSAKNLKENIDTAKQRKAIYNKLNLFKAD